MKAHSYPTGLARKLGHEVPQVVHPDHLGLNVTHSQTQGQVLYPDFLGALPCHCRSHFNCQIY